MSFPQGTSNGSNQNRGMPGGAGGRPYPARMPGKKKSNPWVWIGLAVGVACVLLAGLALVGALIYGWSTSQGRDVFPSNRTPTWTRTPRSTRTWTPTISPEPYRRDTDTPSPTFTLSPSWTPTPPWTFTPSPTATSPAHLPAGMLEVPAGDFTMGDSISHASSICLQFSGDCETITFADEAPAHLVHLDAFWIDQTEVSNAMYAQCVAAHQCSDNGKSSNNLPATNVSWHDAAAYCAWAGKRLPTEAEWEKAARGTDGRTFPWGNAAPTCAMANFDPTIGSACNGKAVPVGSYPGWASPYGALDMAGNVWEWVADWFEGGYYSHSPYSNPTGPATGELRVMRGGSFINPEGYLVPTGRGMNYPEQRTAWAGFRCAADP